MGKSPFRTGQGPTGEEGGTRAETVVDEGRAESGDASACVRLTDVCHSYATDGGQLRALEDVDLTVGADEVVCVLGPSGCGKTTLLRLVAGLLEPDSGTVLVGDEPVRDIPDDVGFVFQDYENSLMQWKDVYANVEVGAEMNGTADADVDGVVRRCLDATGLDGFEHSDIHELSGGMKQRVQVARMLAYDPQILLCDEPFGALDVRTKETLQEEFLHVLQREPMAVLFVTHDIEEAIFLADRVYVFRGQNPGRVERTEVVDFERPRTPKAQFEAANSKRIKSLKHELRW